MRDRVNFIRSVQQGLCSIDDVDDYGLADYGENEPEGQGYEDVGDETGEALKACHNISKEQRERTERNRQMAEAARRRAASAIWRLRSVRSRCSLLMLWHALSASPVSSPTSS